MIVTDSAGHVATGGIPADPAEVGCWVRAVAIAVGIGSQTLTRSGRSLAELRAAPLV